MNVRTESIPTKRILNMQDIKIILYTAHRSAGNNGFQQDNDTILVKTTVYYYSGFQCFVRVMFLASTTSHTISSSESEIK